MPERPNSISRRWFQLIGLGARYPLIELTARTGRAFCGPLSLGIFLGSGCNLRCRHCFFWDESGKNNWIDFGLAEKILNQAREAGIRQATFTGGEPLLYPRFESLIAVAEKLGMITGFPTNGTLLTPQRCEALIDAGIDRISVSLDGSTPEIHDPLRGRGTWERAMEGLENLIRARTRSKANIEIRINSVVLASNVDDLPNLLQLARKSGVALNLMPFHVQDLSHRRAQEIKSRAVEEFRPGGPSLELLESRVIPALIREKHRAPGLLNPDSFLRMLPVYYRSGMAPRKCRFGAFQMSVGSDGVIGLCIPEIGVAGNAAETTLVRAWRSPDMSNIRARVRKCRSCMLNCSYIPTFGDLIKDHVLYPARHRILRTVKSSGERKKEAFAGA